MATYNGKPEHTTTRNDVKKGMEGLWRERYNFLGYCTDFLMASLSFQTGGVFKLLF